MLAATRFPLASASAVAAQLNGPAMEEIVAADESFYNSRLASRQALAWYNRQLLDELPRLPRPAAWHEIGGGGGLLPIALGMMGYQTANIEPDEVRFALGERILAHMETALPGLAGRVRMVCGAFPEVLEAGATLQTAGAFAITTNMSVNLASDTASLDRLRAFLHAIKRHYAGYIFDVCLLGNTWRCAGGWQQILALAAETFGCEPHLLFTKREDYARYYFVDLRP